MQPQFLNLIQLLDSDTIFERRDFLQLLAMGLAGSAVAKGSHQSDKVSKSSSLPQQLLPWYKRLIVGVEYGPTGVNDDTVYMSKANGRTIVQNLLKQNAEYIVLFARDFKYAYYDSKLEKKCPGLSGRDLLAETIGEAQKHKIPVIAYCQIQNVTSTWELHPDWRMKDNTGHDIPGNTICFNSDYLDYIKQLAAEMMAYPIDGFHFDMLQFTFGPPYACWCDNCRREFQKQYGKQLPNGPVWDKDWDTMLQFRYDSNNRFCTELYDFIKAKRPDIAVDFNYHGYPPSDWSTAQRPVERALIGDFITCEGMPHKLGHNNPSLLSRFIKSARPDGPWQIASPSGVRYHDFTVRSLAETKWEVLTYAANGIQFTMVDKAYYDGIQDPLLIERLGKIFAEVKQKRSFFGHEPLDEVGLYYSLRSRDWFGREIKEKYMAAIWGAHLALMQSQIPMGMIMDENVTIDRLRQFPVVYLSNTAILSQKESEIFYQYVQQGGNLLITGLTGLYDYYGNLTDKSILENLISARFVRAITDYTDNYVCLPAELNKSAGKFLTEDVPVDWTMITEGPIAVYETTGAQTFGQLFTAYRTKDNVWSNHMSPEKAVGPFALINRCGKGTVVLVPCGLDAAYVGNFRMFEHKNIIRNIVRYLNPNPPVKVRAPSNVEVIVTKQQKKHIFIHMLCFSAQASFAMYKSPAGRSFLPSQMEEPMTYKAQIDINTRFSKIVPYSKDTKISGSGKQFKIETSSVHEILKVYL